MKLTLRNSQALTDTIYSFQFEPERPVDYIAGQFIELTIPHANPDAKGTRRWFTLSSSPTEPLVAITVRCQPPLSSFKQALHTLQPGQTAIASDPMGDFVLPLDSSLPLIWIAAGIGITPFRSMAVWLAANHEQRHIRLIHSVRDHSEAIYSDIFQAAHIPEQTTIDTTRQARLGAANILKHIPSSAEQLLYISGPETMVATLSKDLQAAGISRQYIITDQFLGYS